MTKFAIAFATAGILLAMPSFSAPASADPTANIKMAQVDVRIGGGGRDRRDFRRKDRCSTTVVVRNGRRSVIKKCR